MLVCTQTHDADGFGEILEGTLWADDSPFVTDANRASFVAVPALAVEPAGDIAPTVVDEPAAPAAPDAEPVTAVTPTSSVDPAAGLQSPPDA